MSHEITGRLFCAIVSQPIGCAVLYCVYRCLKSGRVIFGGGIHFSYIYRKEQAGLFWFLILVYTALGIFFLFNGVTGTYHILTHPNENVPPSN
jgi:hypothetical protein